MGLGPSSLWTWDLSNIGPSTFATLYLTPFRHWPLALCHWTVALSYTGPPPWDLALFLTCFTYGALISTQVHRSAAGRRPCTVTPVALPYLLRCSFHLTYYGDFFQLSLVVAAAVVVVVPLRCRPPAT